MLAILRRIEPQLFPVTLPQACAVKAQPKERMKEGESEKERVRLSERDRNWRIPVKFSNIIFIDYFCCQSFPPTEEFYSQLAKAKAGIFANYIN